MYLCAALFVIIGVGSLVVAIVPGADEWVVEWYQAYHAGQNMRDFTRQQIVQFEKVENVLNA